MSRVRPRVRGLGDERGVAAVEFALISVVLFLLIFGIIEFGKTYSQYEVFLHAAREGARVGAVRGSEDSIRSAATDAAQGYSITPPISITVDGNPPNGATPCNDQTAGKPLAVTWDQNFTISIPFLPVWHPTVHIKGVFECE